MKERHDYKLGKIKKICFLFLFAFCMLGTDPGFALDESQIIAPVESQESLEAQPPAKIFKTPPELLFSVVEHHYIDTNYQSQRMILKVGTWDKDTQQVEVRSIADVPVMQSVDIYVDRQDNNKTYVLHSHTDDSNNVNAYLHRFANADLSKEAKERIDLKTMDVPVWLAMTIMNNKIYVIVRVVNNQGVHELITAHKHKNSKGAWTIVRNGRIQNIGAESYEFALSADHSKNQLHIIYQQNNRTATYYLGEIRRKIIDANGNNIGDHRISSTGYSMPSSRGGRSYSNNDLDIGIDVSGQGLTLFQATNASNKMSVYKLTQDSGGNWKDNNSHVLGRGVDILSDSRQPFKYVSILSGKPSWLGVGGNTLTVDYLLFNNTRKSSSVFKDHSKTIQNFKMMKTFRYSNEEIFIGGVEETDFGSYLTGDVIKVWSSKDNLKSWQEHHLLKIKKDAPLKRYSYYTKLFIDWL